MSKTQNSPLVLVIYENITNHIIVFLLFSLLLYLSINERESTVSVAFDSGKWQELHNSIHNTRLSMYQDLMSIDSIRKFNEIQIIDLLGSPDKLNNGHLYYTLSQKKLGIWSLHTKTLVIKMKESGNAVDWMKISE